MSTVQLDGNVRFRVWYTSLLLSNVGRTSLPAVECARPQRTNGNKIDFRFVRPRESARSARVADTAQSVFYRIDDDDDDEHVAAIANDIRSGTLVGLIATTIRSPRAFIRGNERFNNELAEDAGVCLKRRPPCSTCAGLPPRVFGVRQSSFWMLSRAARPLRRPRVSPKVPFKRKSVPFFYLCRNNAIRKTVSVSIFGYSFMHVTFSTYQQYK